MCTWTEDTLLQSKSTTSSLQLVTVAAPRPYLGLSVLHPRRSASCSRFWVGQRWHGSGLMHVVSTHAYVVLRRLVPATTMTPRSNPVRSQVETLERRRVPTWARALTKLNLTKVAATHEVENPIEPKFRPVR